MPTPTPAGDPSLPRLVLLGDVTNEAGDAVADATVTAYSWEMVFAMGSGWGGMPSEELYAPLASTTSDAKGAYRIELRSDFPVAVDAKTESLTAPRFLLRGNHPGITRDAPEH